MNIPKFRAKTIDGIMYVEGWLKECSDTGNQLWIQSNALLDYQIDPSTLAISFDNMIASGGIKIFASLSSSGKGGDILEYNSRDNDKTVCKLIGNTPAVRWKTEWLKLSEEQRHLKVIGIQE